MNQIPADIILPVLFLTNIVLVLIDASIGYHLAPNLLPMDDPDEPEQHERRLLTIRRMLTGLVTLYMFFNCFGYFSGNRELVLIVAAMAVLDIGGQLYLNRRSGKDGEPQ